jgi:hypothetical protein
VREAFGGSFSRLKTLGKDEGDKVNWFPARLTLLPSLKHGRRIQRSSCDSPRGKATGSCDLFTFAST